MKTVTTLLSTSVALVLALPGSGFAAESSPTTRATKGDEIPEIIVSARKREENLQEVPISITAFTTDEMLERGLTSLEDLSRFTPSFTFHSAFGRNLQFERPSMRGLTTIVNGVGGSKAVTTFIDGIYVGGSASTVELANLERVEILKGPQSAQYGRATYAGAINYVTKRPSDTLEGEVTATAAQHDSYAGMLRVSGPLVPGKINFYVAGGHDEYRGEYQNIRDGSTVGSQETDSVVGKLLFLVSEDFEATVKLGYEQTDDGHFPVALQPRTDNNCCFRTPDAPRAVEYYAGKVHTYGQVDLYTDMLDLAGGAGNRLDRLTGSLKLDWKFGDGYTLTSNTGFIRDDVDENFDASYAGYDPLLYSLNNVPPFLRPTLCEAFACGAFVRVAEYEQTDKSTELRLSSPVDRKLRWTGGLYYYKGKREETRDDRITTPNSYGVTPGQILSNDDLTFEEVENKAAFGSIEWDLAERWTATAELRWAEDEVQLTNVTDQPAGPADPPAFTPKPGEDFRETFDSLTPRFTLQYRQTDNLNYYLNIAKGTRPGGFNEEVPLDPITNQPDESLRDVGEEKVWSYELGMKSRLFDGRATLNLAGYYMDVTDQQVSTVFELADGTTTSALTNAGKTRVYGLEAELSALLTDNLTMTATYSYTNSEFRKFISQEQADLMGSDGTFADVQALGSVAGHKVPRIPENMASLFLRYERPLAADWQWYASGDISYQGSRYAQIHNLAKSGDQTLVGMRLGIKGDNWDVSLFGKNIFDDDTPVDVLRFIDTRSGVLPVYPADPITGAPNSEGASRTPRGFGIVLPRLSQWGVTARYRF